MYNKIKYLLITLYFAFILWFSIYINNNGSRKLYYVFGFCLLLYPAYIFIHSFIMQLLTVLIRDILHEVIIDLKGKIKESLIETLIFDIVLPLRINSFGDLFTLLNNIENYIVENLDDINTNFDFDTYFDRLELQITKRVLFKNKVGTNVIDDKILSAHIWLNNEKRLSSDYFLLCSLCILQSIIIIIFASVSLIYIEFVYCILVFYIYSCKKHNSVTDAMYCSTWFLALTYNCFIVIFPIFTFNNIFCITILTIRLVIIIILGNSVLHIFEKRPPLSKDKLFFIAIKNSRFIYLWITFFCTIIGNIIFFTSLLFYYFYNPSIDKTELVLECLKNSALNYFSNSTVYSNSNNWISMVIIYQNIVAFITNTLFFVNLVNHITHTPSYGDEKSI